MGKDKWESGGGNEKDVLVQFGRLTWTSRFPFFSILFLLSCLFDSEGPESHIQLSRCSASMFPCFLHGCLCMQSCWLAKEICMFSPLVHISANTGDDLLHYAGLFSHCYEHFTKKEQKSSSFKHNAGMYSSSALTLSQELVTKNILVKKHAELKKSFFGLSE